MAKKNAFAGYIWEKRIDGTYEVYSQWNGKSIVVIKYNENIYRIIGSKETEINTYGQEIPKRYNKFEVMEYLSKQ